MERPRERKAADKLTIPGKLARHFPGHVCDPAKGEPLARILWDGADTLDRRVRHFRVAVNYPRLITPVKLVTG